MSMSREICSCGICLFYCLTPIIATSKVGFFSAQKLFSGTTNKTGKKMDKTGKNFFSLDLSGRKELYIADKLL